MANLCYLKCNFTLSKVARLEHVNGNTYVGREEWRLALKHYERGVKLLEETSLKNEEEENRRQHLMLKLQLNVAYCALKMKWPKKACTACKEALTIEDNNTKALFRYGKAQRMLEDFKKARHFLVRAQRNKPGDVHINEELRSLHTAPDCASSGGPFFIGSLFVIMMYLRGYLVISEAT